MIVREARQKDIDWILSELKEFSDEYGTQVVLYDEFHAREGVKTLVKQHVVYLAEDKEGPKGFIAGFVAPHVYNPNLIVLSECFWWVPKKHRGSRAGLLLLRKFVKWGKENVDWILFGIESQSPVNPDCLIKRGFKLHERNYLMEVN